MKIVPIVLTLVIATIARAEVSSAAVPSESLAVQSAPREIASDAETIQDTLTVTGTSQHVPRILLTGQEYHQAGMTSTDGLALLLGVNRPSNRQLWIVDSTQVATPSSTNTGLRILVGSGAAHVSGLATDGITNRNLVLNSNGGGVSVGMIGPSTAFEVRGAATAFGPYRRVVRLWDDSAAASGVGAGIDFIGRYNTTGTWSQFANIKGVKANGTDGDPTGNLVVSLENGFGAVEVLRIAPNALSMNGNAHFTGTVTGGNIQAKYQDIAEWVPSSSDLEPGTVVVLDPAIGNGVMASMSAYDTAVAGVVSAQPGIILGEAGAAKEQVATTGRVRVRVDASAAPIRVGDLLVTSGKPGMAMRSVPMDIDGRKFHQPGTIIGKALEALESGEGEILVLLSLQ